jgi:hypothetical protein
MSTVELPLPNVIAACRARIEELRKLLTAQHANAAKENPFWADIPMEQLNVPPFAAASIALLNPFLALCEAALASKEQKVRVGLAHFNEISKHYRS